jgi:hypothetical protein
MHGKWSLDLKGRSGLADFSAEMTMELSDHAMDVAIANGVVTNGVPTTFDDPETRIPHTHHITMKDAKVTFNTDTSTCRPTLPRFLPIRVSWSPEPPLLPAMEARLRSPKMTRCYPCCRFA